MSIIQKADNADLISFKNYAEANHFYKNNPNCKCIKMEQQYIRGPKGELLDIKCGRWMPIFYTDKLEDIVKRWCNTFKHEADEARENVKLLISHLDNEKGWSKGKEFRVALKVPNMLNDLILMYDPNFFDESQVRKNARRLKEIMPELAVGNV